MKSTMKPQLLLLWWALLSALPMLAKDVPISTNLVHPSVLPPSAMSFSTTATGSFDFTMRFNASTMVVIEWTDQNGPHHQTYNYTTPQDLTPNITLTGTAGTTKDFQVYVCPEYVSLFVAQNQALTALDISQTLYLEILRVNDNELSDIVMADPNVDTYFALTEFRVYENPLTQDLDLRKCPELVYCFLSDHNGNPNGNPAFNVSTLLLEGLSKLEIVRARSCGLANDMDLTGCTNLTILSLEQNAITGLYLSNLANLQTVQAWSNQLTNTLTGGALDLSASRNTLRSVNLGSNNVGINQLTTLDLGAPPYPNLIHFNANENLLTNAFDFSGSPLLESIELGNGGNNIPSFVAHNCPALVEVNVRGNALTAPMAFPGCPNLTNLFAQFNAIPSIDFTGLSNLETVAARNNQLDYSNSSPVGLDLSSLNKLISLDMQNNTNIPQLILPSTSSLFTVRVNSCNLVNIGSSNSPTSISGCANLSILSIPFNLVTDLDIELNSLNALTQLQLTSNQLTASSIEELIDELLSLGAGTTGNERTFSLHNNPGLGGISCTHKKKLNGLYNNTSCGAVSQSLGVLAGNSSSCGPGIIGPPTNFDWCLDVDAANL